MPIAQLSKKTKFNQSWRGQTSRKYSRKTSRLRQPTRSKYSRPRKKKRGKLAIIKTLVVLGILGGLAGSIAMLALFGWASQNLPDPNNVINRTLAETTTIYDRTGETILYEIHGAQNRTRVKLEDVPDYIKWATIVREDKEFYSHPGFNLKGIIRAILTDVTQGKSHGGSSITQQFIKNAVLTPEKTFTRKAKELMLAYKIEQEFTKDEILEMYLNEIPYGSTAYGIEAASQTYFAKSIQDLSLRESAVLAALPKAPSYYSPYGSHRDELLVHTDTILRQMYEEKYISEEEMAVALAGEVDFKPKREYILAPHFVFYVKELLTEKYGEKMIEEGGLKIYTTLDMYKQKIAEEVITEGAKKNLTYNASNAALVALDPKNGQILTMVGSKDYFAEEIDGNVNVTIQPRQPGSSFKPFVYAAAFKRGYTPDTILYDVKTVFATAYTTSGEYAPQNYNNKTYGPVSIRKALAGSLNIPAVKAIYLAGIDNVLDLAEDLGYTTFSDRSRFGLSLVLGGGEIKLLEHAHAYAALARDGWQTPLTAILKIKDKDDRVIEEWQEPRSRQVLDSQVVRQVNSILTDNTARSYVFGEYNNLTLGSRPVAAKTGTTNDFRDAWTLGFTPSLVTGVWVGNNDNSEMNKGASGGALAAPIWHNFMNRVLGNTSIETFQEPAEIENIKPILLGEGMGEIKLKIDKASGKLATELTPESFIEERTYHGAHNILHYIDRNNPTGPVPEDPAQDPEYATWEEAVQKWAQEQGYTTEALPMEYDDLHLPENQPTIAILSPQNNQTITDRKIFIEVTATAPRSISRVEYYLDNEFMTTTYTPIFNLSYIIPNSTAKGFHSLKAIAYDDIDNSQKTSIEFNLTAAPSALEINWQSPATNSNFSEQDLPLELAIWISAPAEMKKITFYNYTSNSPKLIASVLSPQDNNVFLDWAPELPGTYHLYAQTQDTGGSLIQSKTITITIKPATTETTEKTINSNTESMD